MTANRQPLELLFLGSGNAFAPQRYWSSFLLNGRYLFDAPPTALPHLKRAGRPVDDIDVIFISHFHGDHFFGLPFLFLEYAEMSHRSKELYIVGPPGIQEKTERLTEWGFPGLLDRSRYLRHYIEVNDGTKGSTNGIQFEAVRVDHVSDLECYGYSVRLGDRSVAYSGDALMGDAVRRLARESDVFVVECSCWGEQCGPHLTPHDIIQLRRETPLSTVFILTHLDAGADDMGLEGIQIAEDFSTFNL